MKFTKIQALKQCLALWRWLDANPDAKKSEWPGWKRLGKYNHDCPCCEFMGYDDSRGIPGCVGGCPLTGFAWPKTHSGCMHPSASHYAIWHDSTFSSRHEHMNAAHEMVKAIRRAYAQAIR